MFSSTDKVLLYFAVGILFTLMLASRHDRPENKHHLHPSSNEWLWVIALWPVFMLVLIVGLFRRFRGY